MVLSIQSSKYTESTINYGANCTCNDLQKLNHSSIKILRSIIPNFPNIVSNIISMSELRNPSEDWYCSAGKVNMKVFNKSLLRCNTSSFFSLSRPFPHHQPSQGRKSTKCRLMCIFACESCESKNSRTACDWQCQQQATMIVIRILDNLKCKYQVV